MNNMVNFLKQSDIFYQFTPTQLELVANLCQEVVFNSGELIFQENSSSKELYVIAQGEVDILINRGTTGILRKKKLRLHGFAEVNRLVKWHWWMKACVPLLHALRKKIPAC